MSEALADTEWIASWLGLAKDLSYDLRKRDTLNREFKIASIMSTPESDLSTALITDAKSLYDNLNREQFTGAEKRSALEICVIRDSLEALGGQARWVPHEENPVDCMTKQKGNAARMLEFLRTGKFQLRGEAEVMQARKQYRENTGMRNPRPKNAFEQSSTSIGFQSVLSCSPEPEVGRGKQEVPPETSINICSIGTHFFAISTPTTAATTPTLSLPRSLSSQWDWEFLDALELSFRTLEAPTFNFTDSTITEMSQGFDFAKLEQDSPLEDLSGSSTQPKAEVIDVPNNESPI